MDFTVKNGENDTRNIHIPVEILRSILEEIWHVPGTRYESYLKTCALVCRLWLQETRPILFRKLNIFTFDPHPDPEVTPADFAMSMTIFMPLQAPTIDSFLQFLHNTPHACSHVRTLWLSRHMNFCYHPPREQRLLDIEADVLPYIVR